MSVRALLKMRPMAIALLDKRKIRFWDALDKPVGELFRVKGLEEFLDEAASTPIPAPDTEWAALPLYYLIDYLTQEHRQLFSYEVSEIMHLLDIHTLADSSEVVDLKAIKVSFQAFINRFEAHVEEEENHIFLKILRYEACLRDHSVHPEFHRGSLQKYMATPKAKEDRRFYEEATSLAHGMKVIETNHESSLVAKELADLMETLNVKLQDHYDLEFNTLFTSARELERSLYNMTIDGHPAMVIQQRGPMDSGIMRLDLG